MREYRGSSDDMLWIICLTQMYGERRRLNFNLPYFRRVGVLDSPGGWYVNRLPTISNKEAKRIAKSKSLSRFSSCVIWETSCKKNVLSSGRFIAISVYDRHMSIGGLLKHGLFNIHIDIHTRFFNVLNMPLVVSRKIPTCPNVSHGINFAFHLENNIYLSFFYTSYFFPTVITNL